MKCDLDLREGTDSERPLVAEVTLAAYAEYAAAMPAPVWDAYRANIEWTIRGDEAATRIVAELDHQVCGSVLLYPSGAETPGAAGTRLASPEVRLLAVIPALRGRGIGEALMQECIARARRSGESHLTLHTIEFMHSAVRMYRRLGFHRAPELDFEPAPGAFVQGYRRAVDAIAV